MFNFMKTMLMAVVTKIYICKYQLFKTNKITNSKMFEKIIQNLCINAAQRYVERRCVHQVVPSPLPRTWKMFILISSNFISFSKPPPMNLDNFYIKIFSHFYCLSRPPPTNLNTFSYQQSPILYIIFQASSHEPKKNPL